MGIHKVHVIFLIAALSSGMCFGEISEQEIQIRRTLKEIDDANTRLNEISARPKRSLMEQNWLREAFPAIVTSVLPYSTGGLVSGYLELQRKSNRGSDPWNHIGFLSLVGSSLGSLYFLEFYQPTGSFAERVILAGLTNHVLNSLTAIPMYWVAIRKNDPEIPKVKRAAALETLRDQVDALTASQKEKMADLLEIANKHVGPGSSYRPAATRTHRSCEKAAAFLLNPVPNVTAVIAAPTVVAAATIPVYNQFIARKDDPKRSQNGQAEAASTPQSSQE